MKALITSGGTKVQIDDVRYIANFSKGGFGAKIAGPLIHKAKAAQPGGFVHHFYCKDAPNAYMACGSHTATMEYYRGATFWTYDEYYEGVRLMLTKNEYTHVFLAAAVSDYVCEPIQGKMSSKGEVTITLKPTAKILKHVRKWVEEAGKPRFTLVGFKLVAGDTSIDDMLEIAARQGMDTDSDYTVANHMNNLGTKYVIRRSDNLIREFGPDDKYVGEQAYRIIDYITEGK